MAGSSFVSATLFLVDFLNGIHDFPRRSFDLHVFSDLLANQGFSERRLVRNFLLFGIGFPFADDRIGKRFPVPVHRNFAADVNGFAFFLAVNDGDLCNGKLGKVQIFLYSIVDAYSSQNDNFVYEQKKIAADYVLSPYSNVPPGDCIIIEFDEEKEFTDKICEPYRIAIEQGKMKKVDTDGS